MASDDAPLFCDRCSRELVPGSGEFYVVNVQAYADPTPPRIEADDLKGWKKGDWQAVCRDLENYSERELMDQVYRRLQLYLCQDCFAVWIEAPTGP